MRICIVGAGLTGLTLAYLLKKQGIQAILLEARNRIGGRIHTNYQKDKAPIELGATWLGSKHLHINKLLQVLPLEIFQQQLGDHAIYEYLSTSPPQLVQLPLNQNPSFRIKGGTFRLIEQLAKELEPNQILLNQVITQIDSSKSGCIIRTDSNRYTADLVVTTLPPNLLVHQIDFIPALPNELVQLAKQTHTWMGESIKVAFRFQHAFWKEANLSGTIMSNVGPVGEMYDHANVEGTAFALKGFLNSSFHTMSKAERKLLVVNQLKKYYQEAFDESSEYLECVWRQEPYTFTSYEDNIFPHQNNGHPSFRLPYMDGKLLIAGSETAKAFPGYMDGAVQSAYEVYHTILEKVG